MLDAQNLEDKKNFLIRELKKYGGVDFSAAYKFVERDIMACLNGVEEEEMINILEQIKKEFCRWGNLNE